MSARDSFQDLGLDDIEPETSLPARATAGTPAPRHALAATAQLSQIGLVLGELVALVDEGRCPLITYAGMRGVSAVPARSLVELSSAHVGHPLALMFERGDIERPIITGLLKGQPGWPLPGKPEHVQVEASGETLTVSARERLVLRCGKSSITLNADGQIEIRGETIVTQARGANRIRGGSVELN